MLLWLEEFSRYFWKASSPMAKMKIWVFFEECSHLDRTIFHDAGYAVFFQKAFRPRIIDPRALSWLGAGAVWSDRVSTKSRFFRSVCHPIKRRVGGQYAVARFVRGAFFGRRWIRDTKIPPRQNYHPQWRGLENPREKGCATLGWGGKSNAAQFFKTN